MNGGGKKTEIKTDMHWLLALSLMEYIAKGPLIVMENPCCSKRSHPTVLDRREK
jgi:hypothetical protein